MEHQLPELPFSDQALAPFISKETLDYHYGKHHKAYVETLNKLILGTEFSEMSLETIIKKAPSGPLYNNAAQHYNHSFFWNCLHPQGGGTPKGALLAAITQHWGSYDQFKAAFLAAAVSNFGSGWTWLVKKTDGHLEIINMGAAGNPLTTDDTPLLCLDVWEHAYYIDYRNARAKFAEAFLEHLVHWHFAERNFI